MTKIYQRFQRSGLSLKNSLVKPCTATARIDSAFWIDIDMQFIACWEMMLQFQRTNFNNTMAIAWTYAGSFCIKDNFTQFSLPF